MRRKIKILFVFLSFCTILSAQQITLRFTSEFGCSYQPLDSILIENITKGCDTVLYYPDTVLNLVYDKIDSYEYSQNGFYISQNYPNPFDVSTKIEMFVPEQDFYNMNIVDVTGRNISGYNKILERGLHNFEFQTAISGNYFLSVFSSKYQGRIKMIKVGDNQSFNSNLNYIGLSSEKMQNKGISTIGFTLLLGDELKFTGFISSGVANFSYTEITDFATISKDYIFSIGNSMPAQPDNIIGETNICALSSGLIYEVNEIQGVNFDWTLPTGWEIISGQGSNSIIVIAGVTQGQITVKAVNDCGASLESILSIAVRSISIAPDEIQGITSICNGQSSEFVISGGSLGLNADWYWYEDDCDEISIGNGTSINLSPSITTNYFVKAIGECNTTECKQLELIVNQNPIPIINSNSPVCEEGILELSVEEGVSWVWTGPNDFQNIEQNSIINNIQTLNAGTYNITVTDENGCTGTTQSDITVKTLSIAPSQLVGDSGVCQSYNTTISVEGGSLGTNANWYWYSGSCGTNFIDIGESINVAPATETNFYARAEGDCNTTICEDLTITILPNPNPLASNNSPICAGQSLNLSVNEGVSWNWTGPNGFSTSIQNPIISNVTENASGIYSVTVTDMNGCTAATQTTVTLKLSSIAAIGINGNTDVCLGQTTTLYVNGGALGQDANWIWYSGACGTNYIGTGLSMIVDPLLSVNYYVRAEGECNITPCATLELTIKTVPETPIAATHIPAEYNILWNWTASENTIGYKYNTINNYYTAIDIGSNNFLNQTNLRCYNPFVLYVWAYNECGASEVLTLNSHTTDCIFVNCGDTVTYHEYNYPTVQIGDQCWFAENSRYLPYIGGTGDNRYTPYYHVAEYFGTDINEAKATENYQLYGALYNWQSAQYTACPNGWGVPSENEWQIFKTYLSDNNYYCGSITENVAKSIASQTTWNTSTTDCAVGNNPALNNSTGFNAKAAGGYYGESNTIGNSSLWWTTYESGDNTTHLAYIGNNSGVLDVGLMGYKWQGYTVRCKKQ